MITEKSHPYIEYEQDDMKKSNNVIEKRKKILKKKNKKKLQHITKTCLFKYTEKFNHKKK